MRLIDRLTSLTVSPWCAGALLLLAGCGKHPAPRADGGASLPVAQVRVASAESKRLTSTEEVVGTVRSTVHATLEAKVSGRIQEMPLRLGQAVKTGDLVARLDAADVKARLEQAQASLQQAERDWNRISSLFKGQAVTRSEYDQAESRQRLGKAAVAEAEAMMHYAEIAAPFNGVVSRKWAEVGDFASPGKPLVEIEDPSSLQLEADVPESLAAHIQLGTTLATRVDGLNSPVQGKVSEMAPSADPASRTVRIKVALVQTPGLMPGRFARLLVPVDEISSVGVPTSAVVRRGQLEMVFVVSNQHAHLHLVKTGKQLGDQVAILSGLDAGDVVVIDGASLLTDGQRVEVK
jgi:RND family efflux transporter MFP subunit